MTIVGGALLLLFTGAMLALPFGILVWVLYFQPRREGRRWATLASELGLELEPWQSSHAMSIFAGKGPSIKQRMLGARGGVQIAVGVRIVVTGSGKNRSVTYYTYVEAYFRRSLGMDLRVSPTGKLGRLVRSVVGESDVQLGDERLDPYYDIRGREPDHVRALLTLPYVREPLAWCASERVPIALSDARVRCERRGKFFEPGLISRSLDTVVDVARRIASARAQVGPSGAERAMTAGWQAIAAQRGLDLVAGVLSGRIEGAHVEVRGQLGGGFQTTFTARFDRRLGVGLVLKRQGLFHGIRKLLGMQDIETGDAAFDARFVVQGRPPEVVRGLLTSEVRASLVALQEQSSSLLVEDDYVSAEVEWLVTDSGLARFRDGRHRAAGGRAARRRAARARALPPRVRGGSSRERVDRAREERGSAQYAGGGV